MCATRDIQLRCLSVEIKYTQPIYTSIIIAIRFNLIDIQDCVIFYILHQACMLAAIQLGFCTLLYTLYIFLPGPHSVDHLIRHCVQTKPTSFIWPMNLLLCFY